MPYHVCRWSLPAGESSLGKLEAPEALILLMINGHGPKSQSKVFCSWRICCWQTKKWRMKVLQDFTWKRRKGFVAKQSWVNFLAKANAKMKTIQRRLSPDRPISIQICHHPSHPHWLLSDKKYLLLNVAISLHICPTQSTYIVDRVGWGTCLSLHQQMTMAWHQLRADYFY